MSTATPETAAARRSQQPQIVINTEDLAHIEGLAEGAFGRNPALADRLLEELGRARIVEPADMPRDVIGIGSRVTYRDEATKQTRRVTLVYPENADITRDMISVMTPIGVALLGLAEGAAFHWDTRDDERRMLTVIHVEADPELTASPADHDDLDDTPDTPSDADRDAEDA
ncbi:nucleoside diphosphate kinase regulator [Pararhodobacter oceanensis]|uniref:nucleoside diphosphate kinase regulator n=1 Tax=Pararhodobacter oceanensis TaxID=2172121 RepID=UPI003A8E7799